MKKITSLLLMLTAFVAAQAEVRMPVIFGDNMVLQQQSDVAIWGEDDPGTKISIRTSWGEKGAAVADVDGKWRCTIATSEADNVPQSFTVKGSSTKEFKNVLFGEVWLCSGQSNMFMRMADKANNRQIVWGSNDAIIESRNPAIRHFDVTRATSEKPLNDVETVDGWQEASPATTGNFIAVGYFFARRINAVLDVPVGIINTSWGGTPVESWMDRKTIDTFKGYSHTEREKASGKHLRPTQLYNAMVHPLVGYTVKGFLWYQGENNRPVYKEYADLFTAMIESWRELWNDAKLPFYYVQIAPLEEPANRVNSAFLREAQTKVLSRLENIGMVSLMDIGDQANIHPGRKREVGERLANWAFAKQYGLSEVGFCGPIYRSMKVAGNGRVTLTFDYGHNMFSYNQELTGFEVAGADRKFYPAVAAIAGNGANVTVYSDEVAKPVAVRYCFKKWAVGNLFNSFGLPASSFRTDNWDDVGAND